MSVVIEDSRNEIHEAWDKLTGAASEETPEPASSPEPVSSPEAEPAAPKTVHEGRDERGRFAPKAGAPAEADPAAPKAPKTGTDPLDKGPDAPVEPAEAQPAPEAAPTAADRPPQSWKPVARERWATLPPEVKAEVIRREREQEGFVRETAPLRQRVREFDEMVRPFEGFMAAAGHSPVESIRGLLQTAAALHTLPPGGKAEVMARTIRSFGIDLNLLANALEGVQSPQEAYQPQRQPEPPRDPRLDQLLEAMNRREVERIERGYAAFAETHEFFEDVREDMAFLIERAAEKGVDLSDEDAYHRAVRMNPELDEVLRQREAAAQATNPRGSTARAAAAAGSLKPASVVSPGPVDPDDRVAVLNAAWDRLSGQTR